MSQANHQHRRPTRQPSRRSEWVVMLVVALLCGFVVSSSTEWMPNEQDGPSQMAGAAAAQKESTDWPVFRGNSQGTGIATSPLPDDLKLLWKFPVEKSFFEATAAIVDGVVYVGDGDSKFFAIDLESGKKKWEFTTELGFSAAAAVRDGRIYVGDLDGVFYCLDAATGKALWKQTTGGPINSSANFFKDSVLVGSQDGTVHRFAMSDGKILWKYLIEASGGIQCSPTLSGNRAFIAGCDSKLHVLDITNGKPEGTIEIGSPTLSTPATDGDFVYFGTHGGTLMGVNWRESKIAWQHVHKRKRAYRGSPALTKNAVIIGGENKRVEAIDRKTGEPLWSFTTKGRVNSSPVVVGDRVFFGSADGRLYAVDRNTGEEVWQYDTGGGFVAAPAVASGRLIIGNDDGTLYCFGEK